MEEIETKFYGKKDLKGYIYYYYLPGLTLEERRDLSEKILLFQGEIKMTLTANCIVLINRSDDIKTKMFKEEVLSFGSLLLYHHGKIKKIKSEFKDKNEELYCISLSDFLSGIKNFENIIQNYRKLISYGLPKDVKTEALIAVLRKHSYEKKTQYYEFPRLKRENIKNNQLVYDIPIYFEAITRGFSPFCTLEEKKLIMNYYNNNTYNKESSHIKICKLPEPNIEHNYCHLCNMRYQNFRCHIISPVHMDNINSNQLVFKRINDTFKRIRDYWSENKKKAHRKEDDVINLKGYNDKSSKNKSESKINANSPSSSLTTSQTINNNNNQKGFLFEEKCGKFGKRKYKAMKDSLRNIPYSLRNEEKILSPHVKKFKKK